MTAADTPSRTDKLLARLDAGASYSGYPEGFAESWTKLARDAANEIRRLAVKPADDGVREALNALSGWCAQARSSIGAIDGYDYRSGEEFGIRRVEIEIGKRARALSTKAKP